MRKEIIKNEDGTITLLNNNLFTITENIDKESFLSAFEDYKLRVEKGLGFGEFEHTRNDNMLNLTNATHLLLNIKLVNDDVYSDVKIIKRETNILVEHVIKKDITFTPNILGVRDKEGKFNTLEILSFNIKPFY